MGVFWCWVVSVWCEWCVRGCGLVGVGWRVVAGVCGVVSDAHVSGLFLSLGFVFCFVSCLVNNGLPGCVGAGGCLLVGRLGWCGCVLVARRGVGWWLVVFAFVCGRVGVFCGRVKVCLSASCGLLGCCLCVGLAWCACGATGCCLACEGV